MYDYETCSEEVLVRRARRGDVKAFATLYEKVYKDLYRFALCLMRHPQEAEDAVGETVVTAYEQIHKLRKAEAFRSWIFKILVNVCRRRQQDIARWWPGNEQKEAQMVHAGWQQEPDLGMAADVKRAFQALSGEEQLIVALSVFAGYNSTEIGKMIAEGTQEMNASTVRSKRRRALEKMSGILG